MTTAPTPTQSCTQTLQDALASGDWSQITTDWTLDAVFGTPKTTPHQAALYYATALDIPVFPCNRDKSPATKHGLLDATTDVDQINQWWKRDSDFNPAMRTGIKFDVVDVDGVQGHKEMLALAEDVKNDVVENPLTEVFAVVYTPRPGGVHYWVTPGEDSGSIDTRIDYKGLGGYVLLPPSWIAERSKGYQGYYRFARNPTEPPTKAGPYLYPKAPVSPNVVKSATYEAMQRAAREEG